MVAASRYAADYDGILAGAPEPLRDKLGAFNRAALVDRAYEEPLQRLVGELSLCRRYHEATFPSLPVGRLIFVGGEARHRSLCQNIARQMDLAAQIGDPMVRFVEDPVRMLRAIKFAARIEPVAVTRILAPPAVAILVALIEDLPLDALGQLQLGSRWFTLDLRVEFQGAELMETALIDARLTPSRVAKEVSLAVSRKSRMYGASSMSVRTAA